MESRKSKTLSKPEARPAKTPKVTRPKTVQIPAKVEPKMEDGTLVRVGPRFEITIDRIEAGTIIGDLMVVFPRTREVLKKHGLNLDVEEAGDIYMSLEAFAALRGLKTPVLVEELEEASKEVPPPPMAAIIAAPAP